MLLPSGHHCHGMITLYQAGPHSIGMLQSCFFVLLILQKIDIAALAFSFGKLLHIINCNTQRKVKLTAIKAKCLFKLQFKNLFFIRLRLTVLWNHIPWGIQFCHNYGMIMPGKLFSLYERPAICHKQCIPVGINQVKPYMRYLPTLLGFNIGIAVYAAISKGVDIHAVINRHDALDIGTLLSFPFAVTPRHKIPDCRFPDLTFRPRPTQHLDDVINSLSRPSVAVFRNTVLCENRRKFTKIITSRRCRTSCTTPSTAIPPRS